MRGHLYDRSAHTNHAHPVVDAIGDEQVALPIDPAAVRAFQTGVRGGAAVAIASLMSAGDGGYNGGLDVDEPDGVVLGVHHDQIVSVVTAQCLWGSP